MSPVEGGLAVIVPPAGAGVYLQEPGLRVIGLSAHEPIHPGSQVAMLGTKNTAVSNSKLITT
jgi:hypothetical protein